MPVFRDRLVSSLWGATLAARGQDMAAISFVKQKDDSEAAREFAALADAVEALFP